MSYVIELLFNPEAEAAIRDLWRRIADAGYPSSQDADGYCPHLTLAVSDAPAFDVAGCQARLAGFARGWDPFPIQLNHLGLFQTIENVVFLGVVPSQTLLDLHQAAFGLCQRLATDWRGYYAPSQWTPHVTLAFDLTPEQALGILALAWDMSLPIQAHARALQLVEVTPNDARNLILCELGGDG